MLSVYEGVIKPEIVYDATVKNGLTNNSGVINVNAIAISAGLAKTIEANCIVKLLSSSGYCSFYKG